MVIGYEIRKEQIFNSEEATERDRELLRERLEEDSKNPVKRAQVIKQKIATQICTAINFMSRDDYNRSIGTSSMNSSHSSSSNLSITRDLTVEENDGDHVSIESQSKAENLCSICLEPFMPGDEVAWSKDLNCNHCFHSDCLMPWLMQHEDCPVCRTALLSKKDFMTRCKISVLETNDERIKNRQEHHVSTELSIEEGIGGDIESQLFEITNGQVSFKTNQQPSRRPCEDVQFPICIR